MTDLDKDNDWYDVLTGERTPANREEQILAELRDRFRQEAADETHTLSESDLQRGLRDLRKAAAPPAAVKPRLPFLQGLAAGILATAIGMNVFLPGIDEVDTEVTKDVGDLLTPSLSQSLNATDNPVAELVALLTEASIDFELIAEGETTTLTFRMPAPAPDSVAAWLAARNIEVLAATVYELSFTKETAR